MHVTMIYTHTKCSFPWKTLCLMTKILMATAFICSSGNCANKLSTKRGGCFQGIRSEFRRISLCGFGIQRALSTKARICSETHEAASLPFLFRTHTFDPFERFSALTSPHARLAHVISSSVTPLDDREMLFIGMNLGKQIFSNKIFSEYY